MAYKCLLDYAALCTLYGDCIEIERVCLSMLAGAEAHLQWR